MKKQANKELLELERKARFDKSITDLNNLVEKMDKKVAEMLEKARVAKLKNSQSSLNLAKVGLANALSTKRRAEQMIMQLDIMSSMKDISELTKGFLTVVQDACDDIAIFTKGNNFGKVGKKVNKAFAAASQQGEMLEQMMSLNVGSLDALNFNFSDELNDEIDALINEQAAASEDALDDEIAKKIEQLKKTQ